MASGTRRVLHVEDDIVNRELLAHVVALAPGWSVTGVGTLAEALAALVAGPPFDLLLVDLDLPDGSGESLLEVDGVADGSMPVWVVTGDASRTTRERLIAAGVGRVLVKPFEIDAVIAALTAVG